MKETLVSVEAIIGKLMLDAAGLTWYLWRHHWSNLSLTCHERIYYTHHYVIIITWPPAWHPLMSDLFFWYSGIILSSSLFLRYWSSEITGLKTANSQLDICNALVTWPARQHRSFNHVKVIQSPESIAPLNSFLSWWSVENEVLALNLPIHSEGGACLIKVDFLTNYM